MDYRCNCSAANDGVEVINMSIGGWRWMAHNLDEKGESASMVAISQSDSICN